MQKKEKFIIMPNTLNFEWCPLLSRKATGNKTSMSFINIIKVITRLYQYSSHHTQPTFFTFSTHRILFFSFTNFSSPFLHCLLYPDPICTTSPRYNHLPIPSFPPSLLPSFLPTRYCLGGTDTQPADIVRTHVA